MSRNRNNFVAAASRHHRQSPSPSSQHLPHSLSLYLVFIYFFLRLQPQQPKQPNKSNPCCSSVMVVGNYTAIEARTMHSFIAGVKERRNFPEFISSIILALKDIKLFSTKIRRGLRDKELDFCNFEGN